MPPSSTAPLRDPASNRTAECASRCHGEASSARTSIAATRDRQSGGNAERGAQGNYHDHETSLQASLCRKPLNCV